MYQDAFSRSFVRDIIVLIIDITANHNMDGTYTYVEE